MTETKILVMSDEHLRNSIRTMGVTLEEDCREAIRKVKEVCDVLKPDLVIHAGDIFDQRKVSPEELHLFRELMDATGVPEERHLTIQGNHDRGGEEAIPQSLGCTSLNGFVYKFNNKLKITGWDYDQSLATDRDRIGSLDADIEVLHFPMSPFNNRVETALKLEDVKENRITIIGDTHVSKLIKKGKRTILSPGALFPQNKTELCNDNSTGLWLIIPEENLIQELQLVHRQGIDLTKETDVEVIRTKINSLLGKKQGKAAAPPAALTPVVYINDKVSYEDVEEGIIVIRVTEGVELNPLSESLESASPSIDSIPTLVKQLIEGEEEAKNISALIMDMWASNDPAAVLSAWLKKEEVPIETDNQ